MLIKLDSSTSNQPSHNFTVNFTNLELEKNATYEIGLVRASVWYSFHNISSEFNNNTLEYSHNGGTNWNTITFSNGIYSVDAINQYVQAKLLQNNHYNTVNGINTYDITIAPNYTTLKVDIILTNNFQVRFNSNIKDLLGFDSSQITITSSSSGNNPANITRSVNSLHIHCSIATGSYENASTSDLIYSFVPQVSPGSLMDVFPNHILYLPINTSNQIQSIRMNITDQLNREVNLQNEATTYLLHLRKKQTRPI